MHADGGEGDADADRVGDGAEHRAEDGAEDGGAEGGADQLAAAVAWCCDRQPGEGAGPGDRARGSLDEPGETERPRPLGGGEREAGEGEEDEPCDDRTLRPVSRRGQPAGDGAEQRAGAEGADEQSGAGLREPELVRVAGHERRERPEQHRVDEHDHADENQKRRTATLPTSDGHDRRMSDRPTHAASGSWRERIRSAFPCATKKFSEPGALSSATPTDFRLPPTAYRCGLDLIASRARCKGESRGSPGRVQGRGKTGSPQIATFSLIGGIIAIRAFYNTYGLTLNSRGARIATCFRPGGASIAPQINSASRWRFRPLLRLTFRLPPTRPPVEPRPNLAPCSLQGGSYGARGRHVKGARSVASANCDFFFMRRLALPIVSDVLETEAEDSPAGVTEGDGPRRTRNLCSDPAGRKCEPARKFTQRATKGDRCSDSPAGTSSSPAAARGSARRSPNGSRPRARRSRCSRATSSGSREVADAHRRVTLTSATSATADEVDAAFAAAAGARPDPRARRQQRARRPERRRRRRPLRRPRRNESRRHLLLRPRRRPPSRAGARAPARRRDRVDPRPDRGARLHGLLRVEGGPARARPLLRGRARAGRTSR